jgi:DNA-binding transcriptional MocR family regulator
VSDLNGTPGSVATRLDPDDARTWVRVAAIVMDRIQDGDYKPGQLLPPMGVLCGGAGLWCSRSTVSKALQDLEKRGAVTRVPGLGYQVTPARITPGTAASRLLEALRLVWDGVYMLSITGSGRLEAWRNDGSHSLSVTTAEALRDAIREDWPKYAEGVPL